MAFMHNGKLVQDDALYQANKSDIPSELAYLEKSRYHLYVSNTCPFSQRILLAINLLGLQEYISISPVSPLKGEFSWQFSARYVDPINNYQHLYQTYQHAKVDYSGRITVPVLWDKKLNTIASTDSFKIAMWLSKQGKKLGKIDLLPDNSIVKIKNQCEGIHKHINISFVQNIKSNFDSNTLDQFFENLEFVNEKLKNDSPYFNGENLTLTDIILLPTINQLEKAYCSPEKQKLTRYRDFDYLYNYYVEFISQQAVKEALSLN
jgi:putative glutathione S-transferase